MKHPDLTNEVRRQHEVTTRALFIAQETYLLRTEYFSALANEVKAKFEALTGVGFTEDQAMTLLTNKVMS